MPTPSEGGPTNPVILDPFQSITNVGWGYNTGAVDILGTYLDPGGFLSPSKGNPTSGAMLFWARGTNSGANYNPNILVNVLYADDGDSESERNSNILTATVNSDILELCNGLCHQNATEYTYDRWRLTASGFSVNLADGKWHFVAISYDGTGPSAQLYVDGTLYTASWSPSGDAGASDATPIKPAWNSDPTVPGSSEYLGYPETVKQYLFAGGEWNGSSSPTPDPFTPAQSDSAVTMGDVWIDFGTTLDLSDSTIIAKIYDTATMTPKNLGANGENVTGSIPDVFLHISKSDTVGNDYATNLGSGGTLTLVGNPIAISSAPAPKVGA